MQTRLMHTTSFFTNQRQRRQGVVVVLLYHDAMGLHEYTTTQHVWRVTPEQLVKLHQLSKTASYAASSLPSASSASLNSTKQVGR